ncbi:hypothetical protein APH_0620 [Anaplasma phagocytophilum str. HZ]|uniref:Uncharacterized protein n=1 Tax=Anaplasma phagocytophilum (strain HZ) TaxID=212042 RepID=Q2GK93_ANAPZ|nr:hypothetical protein APH_0620 [Anaplasma phagocytophilum str. HZ]
MRDSWITHVHQESLLMQHKLVVYAVYRSDA